MAIIDDALALLIYEVLGTRPRGGWTPTPPVRMAQKAERDVMDRYKGAGVGIVIECEGGACAPIPLHQRHRV